MAGGFTFALVVLLIALVLIAFVITNIVYYNNFKRGAVLTANQSTGLVVINVIALILLFVIFFYAIFMTLGGDNSCTPVVAAPIPLPSCNTGCVPASGMPMSTTTYTTQPAYANQAMYQQKSLAPGYSFNEKNLAPLGF